MVTRGRGEGNLGEAYRGGGRKEREREREEGKGEERGKRWMGRDISYERK